MPGFLKLELNVNSRHLFLPFAVVSPQEGPPTSAITPVCSVPASRFLPPPPSPPSLLALPSPGFGLSHMCCQGHHRNTILSPQSPSLEQMKLLPVVQHRKLRPNSLRDPVKAEFSPGPPDVQTSVSHPHSPSSSYRSHSKRGGPSSPADFTTVSISPTPALL